MQLEKLVDPVEVLKRVLRVVDPVEDKVLPEDVQVQVDVRSNAEPPWYLSSHLDAAAASSGFGGRRGPDQEICAAAANGFRSAAFAVVEVVGA